MTDLLEVQRLRLRRGPDSPMADDLRQVIDRVRGGLGWALLCGLPGDASFRPALLAQAESGTRPCWAPT